MLCELGIIIKGEAAGVGKEGLSMTSTPKLHHQREQPSTGLFEAKIQSAS